MFLSGFYVSTRKKTLTENIMKKIIKLIAVIAFISFIVIQFFQIDKTNPAINETETLESSTQVPQNIQEIFKRSCNDCHSDKTVYPFYSYIAPMSWKLEEHIKDGRKKLNLSVWNTYDFKKKSRKLNAICEEVESGSMPMNQYLWIHWEASLSEDDKKAVCNWANAEIEKLSELSSQ